MFSVYMAKNTNNEVYIGVSSDAASRIATHNRGAGALFTRNRGHFNIVFIEEYRTLAEARKREIQLKKWRRNKKEFLIKKYQEGLKTKQSNN